MPPWSLHHLTIAFMASPISLLRPGDPLNPASSPYSTVIAVSVTPWSVEPLASPLPHGDARSPNLPDEVAPLAVVVVLSALSLRLLPHAAATRPPITKTHNSRSHDRRITHTPRVNARRPAKRLSLEQTSPTAAGPARCRRDRTLCTDASKVNYRTSCGPHPREAVARGFVAE